MIFNLVLRNKLDVLTHLIFVLRQTIEHFNRRSSYVYVSFLDASKAFGRVNHCKLFSILIKKGLPSFFY